MDMIKVVVIDPYTRTCEDRMIAKSLASYYETIGNGCNIFEAAYPDALGNECVYVDEEGCWKQTAGFQLRGHHQPLLGRGIVLGTDSQGNSVSTTWTADEVLMNIEGWVLLVPAYDAGEENT